MSPRAELERRVDELAEAHEGAAFAEAVRGYSETLPASEREELKTVLLKRARLLESAVGERYEARGWLRRTLARLDGRETRRGP